MSTYFDPEGKWDAWETAAALHRPDLGQVTAVVRPDARRLPAVAASVLRALGKGAALSGTGARSPNRAAELVRIWLGAMDIQHVYIHGVEFASYPSLTSLLDEAAMWPCEATLVTAGIITAGKHRVLSDRTRVIDALPSPPPPAEPPVPTPEPPLPWTLPTNAAPTFRAACRTVLPKDQFDVVDALYVAVFQNIRERQVAGAGDVGRFLAEQARAHPPELLRVVLRASEAQLLTRGFHLSVDEGYMRISLQSQITSSHLTAAQWATVNALQHPAPSTLVALLAAGVHLIEVTDLSVADVASDGSWVDAAAGRLKMPSEGRPATRAQRNLSASVGEGPDVPLLADGKKHVPRRLLGDLLNALADETGIVLRRRGRALSDSRDWPTAARGPALTPIGAPK